MLLPAQKKLLLVFIILLVVDLFLAITLVFLRGGSKLPPQPLQTWLGYQEQVDQGSLKPAGQILEIHAKYDNAANPFITITDLQKKNGYVPVPTEVYQGYVLELLDGNKIVYTLDFTLPEPKTDPPPLPGQPTGRVDQSMASGEIVLTVPWNENAESVRIRDVNRRTITSTPLTSVKSINNRPSFRSTSGEDILSEEKTLNFDLPKSAQAAVNNHLDIVIVSNGYSDLSKFHSDVSAITKNLLTYEPYKSKASQLAFHTIDNTSNLNCQITALDRLLTCDDPKVVSRVNTSGAPYDAIYVLVNQAKYGGSAGGSIGVGYNGDFIRQMFAHEFGGHVIGNLYDEYNYDETTKGSILNRSMRNCYSGNPPNSAWQGLVNSSSYTKGCSYYNWYRSTPDSIMYSMGAQYYNAVSQKLIRERIDYYVTHSNPSSSATPTPTKRPTATPTKRPTSAPTLRPTATPTPRISLTATPTRSPFPTPTFYCVGACATPTSGQSGPTPTRFPRPTSRANEIRTRLTTTPIPTPPKLESRDRSGIERFRIAIRSWVIEIRVWIRNLFNWR